MSPAPSGPSYSLLEAQGVAPLDPPEVTKRRLFAHTYATARRGEIPLYEKKLPRAGNQCTQRGGKETQR